MINNIILNSNTLMALIIQYFKINDAKMGRSSTEIGKLTPPEISYPCDDMEVYHDDH